MPKIAALQSGFNAGELSPLVYGLTESPRYKKGLETALNYIPTLQGPLLRRPGTKFMNNIKNDNYPPILIPFQFSITQAYILEFGNFNIRFYANNGQIQTTGTSYQVFGQTFSAVNTGLSFFATRSTLVPQQNEVITSSSPITPGIPLEVGTLYAAADLPLLRWAQNNDTLYLVHPNYPPYKLQRFGQTFWTLKEIYFQDGPYLPLNSYLTSGDSTKITLTPSATAGLINVTTGPTVAVAGAANNGSGLIRIQTGSAHGYFSGQSIFISGVTGTAEANNVGPQPASWLITVIDSTHFDLIGSTFVHAYVSGGTVFPALFNVGVSTQIDNGRTIALIMGGKRYWGIIINAAGTFNASTAQVAIDLSNTLPGTTAADGWYLGVYGPVTGYPACASFHQDRLFLAGVPSFPQEVDASNTGEYELFSPSDPATLKVADNNALQFTLASQNSNAIKWLCSNAQGLLAGSASSEWVMSPSSTSEALTPTNFNAVQSSFFGSASIQAIQIGNAAAYVQRAQRKIREMNFFFQVGTFRSTDLTELSEHITLPTVLGLALQKETQPLLWATRSDGNLVSLIYDRNDLSLSAGWTRHQLGGQSDSSGTNPVVTSIAVIPSTDLSFDQLWMVVKRYINGSTIYTIEYMTKIFDDSILQEDAFQLDCGATFYASKSLFGISIATTAVVSSTAHGFSNGDKVKFVSVVGSSITITDVNGNVTTSSLVNEKTFVVAGVTTNTFQLNDFSGNPISSIGYSAYVSGGEIAKLVSSISGATWLENETVSLLCDGAIAGTAVVSNSGVITLPFPAAKVQFGYSYNSDGKLMRTEGGAADGTSIGKTRRTTRAAIQLHRTGDLSIGTSFNNLIPIEFSQADQNQADNAVPLFSGIKREGLESAYDFESQVCFRQNSALPGCIQSITSFMEEQDV